MAEGEKTDDEIAHELLHDPLEYPLTRRDLLGAIGVLLDDTHVADGIPTIDDTLARIRLAWGA